MPRVKAFLDCLGLALCDKARKPLMGVGRFGDCLLDVAKAALDYSHKELSSDHLKMALAELTTLDSEDYQARLSKLVDGLARINSIPFRKEVIDYLTPMPGLVRRFLTRPSDPDGVTVPAGLQIYKPEDLLLFLPPHLAQLRPGQEPKGLENWKLSELLGFGETSETWLAYDPGDDDVAPVALKFAIEDETIASVHEHQQVFVDVFALAGESGIVPLHSVFLESTPPALEYAYLTGYDLASLIWDWKWLYDSAKPEAALKLVRRISDIVSSSTHEIEQSGALADETGQAIEAADVHADAIHAAMSSVAEMTHRGDRESVELLEEIRLLSDHTGKNLALVEQLATASDALRGQGERLSHKVGLFKLS